MQASIGRAQRYIDEHAGPVARTPMRQRYHFMGPCGWINDPNGLIYYKGQYHYFYQFNPFSSFWGKMHWGHAVSDDLVHFRSLPIALAPSEAYDDHEQGGCFSGSAIEKDGKLYLIYTGTANRGDGLEQTQNVAVSEDGVHFRKYEGNPVLCAPEGVKPDCFRDPKVWEHDGSYYMVCGVQKGDRGQALLYRSPDLLHWEFFNVLLESRGELGYMWECPDFFELGGKWVFICSPMGMGDRKVVYFVGDFDYRTGVFCPRSQGEVDWGLDFYAPQTFLDANGRRIMVGWANGWQWMTQFKDWGPTYHDGWCGSLTLPREVTLSDDGLLSCRPVGELSLLARDEGSMPRLRLAGGEDAKIEAGDGVAFRLSFDIDLRASDCSSFDLLLRQGGGRQVVCTFDLEHAQLRLCRDGSDGWSRGASRSTLDLCGRDKLDVTVYSDQSSIEVFADNGTNVHSMNVFAPSSQNGVSVRSHGGPLALEDVSWCGMADAPIQ